MSAPTPGPRTDDAERPLVDPEALTRYLDDKLPGEGTFDVERHQAGHSNETFFVRRSGNEWVLRRPPRGAFLPTAHDVLREYRVLSAVADTPARAPRPIVACEDESILGVPFYVMERIRGAVVRDRLPEGVDADGRRRIGEELVDALAELHAVDWRAVGLEGWGKPTGYLERQVRRWTGQLQLATTHTRPLPDLMTVAEWLSENLPPSPPATIVHGDYKLDNVVLDPGPPPRLAAILDWEMSTIGDPQADLGYLLSMWREPGDPPGEVLSEELELTRQPGFPSRAELLERYRERSGRQVLDLTWYVVLAVWKLAILLEGSYARHLAGVTDDPFFAELEHGVPALARRALAEAYGTSSSVARSSEPPRALVIDFGGVLTTSLGEAFRAFCAREGADYEHVRAKLRQAYGEADPESLVAKFETGRIGREEFETELATALSEGLDSPIVPDGLVARMIADLRMDDRMVSAVRSARSQGIRTALLSNSWGVEYYPHELLADLFDEVVISAEAGLRKPDPQAFRLAAERLGLPPEECLFVDDVKGNVEAAEAVGMRGVVHERAEQTVPELEALFGRQLG